MSSNSRNGFMGWVQKNPGTAFAIFLVFAAIVTAIVMVTRGSASSAGPGAAADSGLPVLEVSGTKVVNSTKTSGYAMKYEYALGEFLGDNVDFTIGISTKSGFEQNGITSLKVIRYKPGAGGAKTELGTKIIPDIKNFKEYEVTFLGQELSLDAVPAEGGKQMFEVIGMTDATTEYTVVSPLASTPADDADAPKISAADLNYVLSGASRTAFTWTVSGASDLRFEKSEALKSKYTLSVEPSRPVLLIPVTNSTSEYTFQYADDTGGSFTVDGVTQFKLDQPNTAEEVYLLYGTKTGETTPGIVTREGGVLSGPLVLRDPRKMTGDEFDMAKVTIREVPKIPGVAPRLSHDEFVILKMANGTYLTYDGTKVFATDDAKRATPIFLKKSEDMYQLVFYDGSTWKMLVHSNGGYRMIDHDTTMFQWKFIRSANANNNSKFHLVNAVTGHMIWITGTGIGFYGHWDDQGTIFEVTNVASINDTNVKKVRDTAYGCFNPGKPVLSCMTLDGAVVDPFVEDCKVGSIMSCTPST